MAMATGRERKTIDGSLLVFLALCVLTALIYLVLFAVSRNEIAAFERWHGPMPISLHIWSYCLAVPQVILPLLVVRRMVVEKTWSTIRLTLGLIWLYFVCLPLIDLAGGWLLAGPFGPHLLVDVALPRFARGIFFAGIGSLYLLRSKRVENTYRHGEIAEVFD
jgi:hypothetical protein